MKITIDRSVVEQTLEALEAMQSYAAAERKGLRICDEAITNLKAALAEPVQEPVAYRYSVQPQVLGPSMWAFSETNDTGDAQPLYTAPPQRPAEPVQEPPASKPWVGLTEKERTDICDGYGANIHWRAFRAIESKLQEKNT